ncbi:MAG: hypothetical protein UT17_C0001G0014 [Candidatus Woesebacteria bacterium GW2011_GWB1_39_10]|uniref:THIF-type NAD/FAD binding fold domain-containing protein n=2 Tax=Candidatus Woeseibacteriota TaxID=1752722 RepID=A0A0G0X6C3_9BACT|nr:MAG: hypothetical protein UT17_C0001G0014 [Candidatus Woesebacteria bacterium GW2011_GWB1_39_10]KKR92200.1 MAG: hypothetical protein UU42_C0002G0014 [Candidatus Woesebacteria bacterium GW2011_GWA1_41_13b]
MQTFRTHGLLPSEALKKTVVVLGLGSVGASFVADIPYEFGMLVLVDPGKLKVENVERHPLGKSHLGWNKADAAKDFLVKEKGVPAGRIKAFSQTDKEVLPLFTNADLVVCAIDDKPSCRRVNDWCFEHSTPKHNIPAIYGGVYPLGLGGEVIAIPTPREVCYRCAERQRATKVLPPAHAGNYGLNPELLGSADSPKAIPALKASITAIVSEMVPLAWRMLFPGDDPVTPQIRFRALEGWIEVARIPRGSTELEIEVREIGIHKKLLLAENNAKITPVDPEGYHGYLIRRQPWPKLVVQWSRCPSPHGGQNVQFSDL